MFIVGELYVLRKMERFRILATLVCQLELVQALHMADEVLVVMTSVIAKLVNETTFDEFDRCEVDVPDVATPKHGNVELDLLWALGCKTKATDHRPV